MKKIRVVCNPVGNQIQFPAEVVNFYADGDDRKVGEKIAEWANKNGKVIISVESDHVIDETLNVIKGEKL